MTLQMLKAGPAGATSVAVAARAPPDDSSTRVPSTPRPTSVPRTRRISAPVTAILRAWSVLVRPEPVRVLAAGGLGGPLGGSVGIRNLGIGD